VHWFDDFTQAVADGRTSRATVLKGLGRLVAGAVLAPLAGPVESAFAQPQAPRPTSTRLTPMHVIKGIPRSLTHSQPNSFLEGACTFRLGSSKEVAFSADSSSLKLSIHNTYSPRRSSKTSPTSVSGNSVVEITSAGESLVRLDSRFGPTLAHTTEPPHTTADFRYGSKLRGVKNASLTVRGGTVAGTIDGKSIVPFAAQAHVAPESVHYSNGHALALENDHALRGQVDQLVNVAKSKLTSCRAKRHTARHTSERPSGADAVQTAMHGRTDALVVADSADVDFVVADSADYANDCCQNGSSMGSGTSHCTTATQQVMTDFGVCIVSAIASAVFCPPCGAAATADCYESLAKDVLGLYVPGVGGCDEVPCGLQADFTTTQFGIRSCDFNSTCCGDNLCCPSGEVCAPEQRVCCPASAPIGCGSESPFCCPSGFACGDGATCFACPQGQVAHNGHCCSLLCGDECCVNGQLCDQAGGHCYYPSFGTPTPRPTGTGSKFMRCRAGLTTCHSVYRDGSTADVCCPSGLACCAGTCCGPGQQCGGNGAEYACGNWIH